MTISKFKFGKKKKATEPVNEYVLDGDYHKDVTYLRRPSFLSQPPVQTPPDLLGEAEDGVLGSARMEEKRSFPVGKLPWKRHKLFSSPFPRYRHSASSVASEKNEIFVMGGLKDGSVFGDTWKIVPQLSPSGLAIDGFVAQHIEVTNNNNPPARVGHSSILCGNAYIIYGGDTVDTDYHGFPDDNFYMFNINNCKYTVPLHILNKPKGRYGHLIGVVLMSASSSRLYLFGGQLENDVYNDIYYFELNSFKLPKARWELIEPLNNCKPPPLTNHTMCVQKHKIYIFGGIYNNEKVSNDLWCFDTLVSKWLQVQTSGELPKPVNEHSSCIVSDIMYVYGGNDFSGTIYDSLYALDLKSFNWSKLNKDLEVDGPGPRCGHTMSFIPKVNKIVIMGGDKNDYIRPGKHDYDTYEESTGNDAGTMIFELDLATADHHMNTLRTTKRAASAGGAAGLVSRRAPLPLPSEDAFTRHRRSLSNFEEYKTPNGSNERMARSLDPKAELNIPKFENNYDKFVDVPSSAVSAQVNMEDPSDIEETTHDNRYKGTELSPLRDDVSESHIDLDRENNNDTPILTRDFAHHLTDSYRPEGTLSTTNPLVRKIPDQPLNGSRMVPEPKVDKMQELIEKLQGQIKQLEEEKATEQRKSNSAIEELRSELADLRVGAAETKSSHEKDVQTKEQLLTEKDAIILELKEAMGPDALDDTNYVEASQPRGITELTRYKVLNLELRNKITHIEHENLGLKEKQARFEPFMNNQIEELSSLQKIIKAQEERIAFLTSQVKLELVLLEEISKLKHDKEDLEMRFNNYKVLNAPLDVSDEEDEDGNDDDVSKKQFSGQLSNKLDDLVSLWQISSLIENPPREIAENEVVTELQKQVEELTTLVKTQQQLSAAEVLELKDDLSSTTASLKVFEKNYKDAMQAAKRTSDALDMTRDELQLKKTALEKLAKENDELKLFQKATGKRASSGENVGEEHNDSEPNGGDIDSGVAAHFNMKIKEMEAELFVMKTENESLSSQVAVLKKELYLAKNQD